MSAHAEPLDWTQARLESMIGQVPESLTLDYKRSDAIDLTGKNKDKNVNELSKDVSAFANSAGGTIIYGMA